MDRASRRGWTEPYRHWTVWALALAGTSPADFQFDIVFDQSPLAGVPCDNGVTVQEGVPCVLDRSWDNFSPRAVWRAATQRPLPWLPSSCSPWRPCTAWQGLLPDCSTWHCNPNVRRCKVPDYMSDATHRPGE